MKLKPLNLSFALNNKNTSLNDKCCCFTPIFAHFLHICLSLNMSHILQHSPIRNTYFLKFLENIICNPKFIFSFLIQGKKVFDSITKKKHFFG